ncbi:uncharacterized protein LOC122655081 [Telopea speciosissima]|uniref:uncharacterized protein LOC122655081 n=1 Tax=Telopea speciosissima TaxID=54955 RepID=UPI001CC4386C|nr:uncharacterized protein LOC122655081 [Telopea speciosissima]
MDVFQSPLEALAFNFNYVSFGFLATTTLQSLFTCFALLTTAVTFWRFTTLASNSFRRTKSSSPLTSSSDNCDGYSTPPPVNVSPPPFPDDHQLELEKKPSHDQEASTCNCVRRRSNSSFVGSIPIEDDENAGNGEKRVNLKDKFTLYYSEDDENREEELIDGVNDVVCSSGAPELLYSKGFWCSDGISSRRGGDLLSWYRYQDLTVLNGSVVRLWDCNRRTN